MKKCLFSLGGLLFFLLAAAQTPVAYYSFNGNANDAAGTNNGTVNGATLTTDRFGNTNSAYNFDGVDDKITAPIATAATNNFSLTGWIKVNSIGTDQVLFYNGNSSLNGYGFYLSTTGNLYVFHGGINLYSTSFVVSANQWIFLAMVQQSGNTKVYVNGSEVFSNTTSTPNVPGDSFYMSSNSTGTEYFNGSMDEIKIFNTALTPVQVQQEFASSNQAQKPGSGNAISFDGTDDFIGAASQQLIAVNSFTMEAWVKPDKAITLHSQSTSGSVGTGGTNSYLFFPTHGLNDIPVANSVGAGISVGTNGVCVMEHTAGYLPVLLTWSGTISGWTHIAVVYTNKQPSLYVNGILVATGLTSTANNIYASNLNSGFPGAYGMYSGLADEIRIWDVSLTPSQIKDRMCKKITGSDALFADLVIYSNFDESSGTVAFDGTVNQLNYNLINGTTRLTSGAAIGTASSHDYVNVTKTASLAHASGESFTVTSTSGNPDGIHVYRVDEQPNTLAGATGVGTNNKYFGVFHVNGTAPQYTAVYNYAGNPGVTPANEFELRLNKRSDNAASSWTTLLIAPDETANTITVTGESTEYILGKLGAPLPLNLISFSANKQNDDALLQWKTANEIDVSRFEVQRSDDGVYFKTFVTVPAGSNDYAMSDPGVFSTKAVVYYRLKSVDVNGRVAYSNIIKLSAKPVEILTVFPNPVQGVVSISGLKQNGVLQLYSAEGKLLQQQTVYAQSTIINMSAYAKGLYLLQYLHNGTSVSQKILKQ